MGVAAPRPTVDSCLRLMNDDDDDDDNRRHDGSIITVINIMFLKVTLISLILTLKSK